MGGAHKQLQLQLQNPLGDTSGEPGGRKDG